MQQQKTAKKLLASFKSLRLVDNAIEVSNAYTKMEKKLLISGALTGFVLSFGSLIAYTLLIKTYSIFDAFFVMFGGFFIIPLSMVGMIGVFCKWGKKLLNRFSKKWNTTEKAYEEMLQEFSILLKTDSVFSQEIYTFLEDAINLIGINKNMIKEKNIIVDDVLSHRVSSLLSRLDNYRKYLNIVANSDKEEVNSALEEFKVLNAQYRESIALQLEDEKELSMGELKKYI